jgi:hypothetical protein
MLAIWTKEDDEAGRTKPKLDTPPVSSVVGSSGKSTGEGTAGLTSIESELTPKINRPDVPASVTSSSPANTASSPPANTASASPANTASSPPTNTASSSPANTPSSSPAKRPAPTHASHAKIARAKHRSPIPRGQNFRVANFDAKARSAAPSPQPVGSYPATAATPASTPNLMKAGNELYNPDYTQPFKNAKKAP